MHRLIRRAYSRHPFATSKFQWQPGDTTSGFTVVSSQHHPDYDCHLHHLLHKSTQSHLYHLERNDPNNCFAPIVQTLTSNDKGAPHILQHLACCGSEKFPVRDPFFNMLKRSLNTYMNAWTGEDFTCYPFSSANAKDYGNLLRVYLDMVFRPKLDYLDFRQEGWRHEVEGQLLKYKGVVLNQMLGAYQSPDRKLSFEMVRNLLHGTPYSFDTGGEPSQIIALQYDELLQMHRDFYQPSNIKYFSYGDQDIREQVLPYLHQEYLTKPQQPTSVHKHSFEPQLLKKQSTLKIKMPESQISLGYYLGQLDKLPREEVTALSMLSYLFFETNQAVFFEELIESGLGDTFTNQYGLAAGKLLTFFFGVKKQEGQLDHNTFNEAVEKALRKVCAEGFSADRIDEVVHQIRISIAMPSRNNGMRLLQKLLTPINHGCDIHAELNYRAELDQLQSKMKDRQYVAGLVEKYFLRNMHHTSVLLQSDMALVEAENLPQPDQQNTNADKVTMEQKQLADRQNDIADSNILPTLELDDIAKDMQKYTLHKLTASTGHKVSFVKVPDTGISHLRAIYRFKKEQIPEDLCKILDLWSYLINKGVSTQELGYKQLSKELSLHSTDFKVTFDHEPRHNEVLVVFSLAALHNNLPKAAQLLSAIISTARFEVACLEDLMKGYLSDSLNDLVENVMSYAKSEAASGLSESDFRKNRLQLKEAGNALANEYLSSQEKDTCIKVFHRIHKLLVECPSLELAVHSSSEQSASVVEVIARNNHPVEPALAKPWQFKKTTGQNRKGMEMFNVDCLASVYAGPQLYSKDAAHLAVFLELLEQKYLHKEIREKGGAYGTGAGQLPSSLICLSSYLDPDSKRTLKVFEESISKLALSEQVSEQEMKQAKLSLFSAIDAPVADYQLGLKEIIYGHTYGTLNQFRRWCVTATASDIKKAAQKWLVGRPNNSAAFGPIQHANKEPSQPS